MDDLLKKIKTDMSLKLRNAIDGYSKILSSLRTGKASISLLDSVKVSVYGDFLPLNQVCSLSIQEAQVICARPWDKVNIQPIERAILKSDFDFTTRVEGDCVYILVPPLTEETRKDIVKQLKKYSENTKVSIRNIRRDANDLVKDLHKDRSIGEDDMKSFLDDLQSVINQFINEVETLTSQKEKTLLNL